MSLPISLKKYVYINTDAPTLEGTTYDKGQTVAQFAQRFVGNSYVWGGTDLNRGADCSGFTQSLNPAINPPNPTEIASNIEVLPFPFSPLIKLNPGLNSIDAYSIPLKFFISTF